jgi:hypothetical protein
VGTPSAFDNDVGESDRMPSKFLIAVLLLLVILSVLKLILSAKPITSTRLRYQRLDLFNSTEHAFLMALRSAAPPHIAVLAKVRVADILSPVGNDVPAFNRIARKHVDFVLYNLQNRSVLRAIELDGPTHASKRAIKSDQVKNSCFASARVPLARVPVADWNKPDTLRSLFAHSTEAEAPSLPAYAHRTTSARKAGRGIPARERPSAAPPTSPLTPAGNAEALKSSSPSDSTPWTAPPMDK